MPLPLPRPQLPEHILQMIAVSVEDFEHQAGAFLPVLRAQGKIDQYRAELDKIARAAFESGLVASAGDRRIFAVPPKGAA